MSLKEVHAYRNLGMTYNNVKQRLTHKTALLGCGAKPREQFYMSEH